MSSVFSELYIMQCEEGIHAKSNENTYICAIMTKLILEIER